MICEPHGMMNDDGKCPYCRIAELEAAAQAYLKAEKLADECTTDGKRNQVRNDKLDALAAVLASAEQPPISELTYQQARQAIFDYEREYVVKSQNKLWAYCVKKAMESG
jgi:hypothetical protein